MNNGNKYAEAIRSAENQTRVTSQEGQARIAEVECHMKSAEEYNKVVDASVARTTADAFEFAARQQEILRRMLSNPGSFSIADIGAAVENASLQADVLREKRVAEREFLGAQRVQYGLPSTSGSRPSLSYQEITHGFSGSSRPSADRATSSKQQGNQREGL